MDKEKLYQERYNRVMDAANLKQPDRVPIVCMAQSFSVGYGGSTLKACLADETEEYRTYDKTFNDFIWDATTRYGNLRNMDFYNILGFNTHIESVDGTCLEHRDITFMKDIDYPEFIKDPVNYILNTEFVMKYPIFGKPYPDSKQAFMAAVNSFAQDAQRAQRRAAHVKNDLALPMLETGIFLMPALDFLLSYFRGFAGLADIRRKPEEVLAADQIILNAFLLPAISGQSDATGLFAFAPALFTPFLTRKQFEKFIWPDYQKLMTQFHKFGGKTFLFMEGHWNHVYDLLNDLPKGSVVAGIEKDDIFEFSKTVGKNVTVVGGIDIRDLKYESKQTCIDKVKKVIDECAADGGYMFAANQILIQAADVNPANLKAVNEFVAEYGVYNNFRRESYGGNQTC